MVHTPHGVDGKVVPRHVVEGLKTDIEDVPRHHPRMAAHNAQEWHAKQDAVTPILVFATISGLSHVVWTANRTCTHESVADVTDGRE